MNRNQHLRNCRSPGCSKIIDSHSIACLDHWLDIPRDIRKRWIDAKWVGGATYQAALRDIAVFWNEKRKQQRPAKSGEGEQVKQTQATQKRGGPKNPPPPPMVEEPPFDSHQDETSAAGESEQETTSRKKDMFWMAQVENKVTAERDLVMFKSRSQMSTWFTENQDWKLRSNEIIRGYLKPIVTKQTFKF